MPEDDLDTGVSKLTVTVTEDHNGATITEQSSTVIPILNEIQPSLRQSDRGLDITSTFNAASAALQQGQLVKDDFFTLFESVGALEIMDPKMDSGFILPDEDAALEDFDPLRQTLPEEIIWIMDQLLSFEMAWHEGSPLSQTLFTSLHMYNLLSTGHVPLEQMVFWSPNINHDKQPLVTSVLRGYCLGLAKCLDNTIHEITSEHFYEEEDFISATFGRLYVNKIAEDDFAALLEKAISDLKELDIASDLKSAINARLRLRSLMLQALSPGQLVMQSKKPDAFRSVKHLLAEMDGSDTLGQPPSVPVFSARVQRYLASNTPPRPMIKTSWLETMKKLNQMCDDVVAAFEVTELFPDCKPPILMRFAWSFASRQPQPLSYARAVAQGLLFKSASIVSTLPHYDLLLSDIKNLVLPASPLLSPSNWATESPSSPRYLISRQVDDFLTRSLDEYLNLYRMPLQNRCRTRRTFAQSVPILDSLQALAEETDSSLISACRSSLTTRDPVRPLLGEDASSEPHYPLASWVYHHKLLAMEAVITLGFELEVYLTDESATQYTLLSFFATTRAEHYAHISDVLVRRLRVAPAPDRAELTTALAFLAALASHARLVASLASSLADLYSLLLVFGLLPVPARPFSSPALRHELRMKPFLGVGSPILPSGRELEAATTNRPPATRLLDICAEADAKIRLAQAEVARLKGMGKEVGRALPFGLDWEREWKGSTGWAIGQGISALKVTVGKEGLSTVGQLDNGAREWKLSGGVKATIPAVGERRERSWVVPKVELGSAALSGVS